jgi:sentrin-specific protease 1
LVMMALALHQRDTMGETLRHFSDSLNTWMPLLYRRDCGMYLSAFYQIFTCKALRSSTTHQPVDRLKVNLICQEIINLYHETEKTALIYMKEQVLALHGSGQEEQTYPTELHNHVNVSFTEQEKALLHRYLFGKEPLPAKIRELTPYFPPVKYYWVTPKDLKTLCPKGWLNDVVVDFYLKLICKQQRGDQGVITVDGYNHAFSSLFWTKLNEAPNNFRAVAKWGYQRSLPGRNIFALNKLAIPIHVDKVHWSCVVVSFKDLSISHYDSTNIESDTEVVEAIFAYLKDEYREIYDAPLPDQELWKLLMPPAEKLPRQRNCYDCGVYCCSYVEFAFNQTPMPDNQDALNHRRQHIALAILNAPEPDPTSDNAPTPRNAGQQ